MDFALAGGSTTQPANVLSYHGSSGLSDDPANPANGQFWLNTSDGQLKIFLDGLIRNITLNSGTLMTPLTDINEYLNLVLGTSFSHGRLRPRFPWNTGRWPREAWSIPSSWLRHRKLRL